MSAIATKVTVEEYAKLTPLRDGRYELRHGEVVKVGFPNATHVTIQWRLRPLLEQALGAAWMVHSEVPSRPLEEYELWGADVAAIAQPRWDAAQQQGWLSGSPELVIEVLSPSNTAAEMLDREETCFAGGCKEFWVVDPDRRLIKTARADGWTHTYSEGDEIPLDSLNGGKLSVSAVFQPSER